MTTSDRERRERITLWLGIGQFAVSLAGVAAIIFAGLQWLDSNEIANENTYQRMTSEWLDQLKILVEEDKAKLRPFFEDRKQLTNEDQSRDQVLAFADVRLGAMDDILSYAAQRGFRGIDGWKTTFQDAFKTSPVLCQRLSDTFSEYRLIVPIGKSACTTSRF